MKNKVESNAKEIIAWNPPINWVRERIEETGNKLGSVYFIKREDGSLRKMSYRLHVRNPSVAKKPKGVGKDKVKVKKATGGRLNRKEVDLRNNQMTVFDANKVVRDENGNIIGRGAWRTVPLENVIRIKNCGTTYYIRNYT